MKKFPNILIPFIIFSIIVFLIALPLLECQLDEFLFFRDTKLYLSSN